MKSNEKNKTPETVREYRKKHKKPQPMRVVMPDKSVRFLGTKLAAAWIGCTPAALGMVLRGIPGRGNVIRSKAMQEFPELF